MKNKSLQDICCSHTVPSIDSVPSRSAIHASTGYVCESPEHALRLLNGEGDGYAYARDGHPNADILAAKCAALHRTECALITSSGMSATSLAVLSQLKAGDHVALSSRLYGRTATVVKTLEKFGVTNGVVDVYRPDQLSDAFPANTRMLIVETISNPLLRVADLQKLSEICRKDEVLLTVDNTFASPILCRPLEHGADLVIESLTKIMNGHGDVTLGMLCGRGELWNDMPETLATWGMTPGPFDSWICERGLSTLFLRMVTASDNAMAVATELQRLPRIERVDYPGLESNPDHETARKLLKDDAGRTLFGNMLTITLAGGFAAAVQFIRSCPIHFVPSLGEVTTTLSHPATTSHKGLSAVDRASLGIDDGTIRFSIGMESAEYVVSAIGEALDGLDF